MQQRTSPNVWAYNKHNKRFKTDSQRVAFLPCVDFSDLGGVRKHRYCVAHHLSGCYKYFKITEVICRLVNESGCFPF
ncbi:DUF3265 domain-containing protein [Vibrio parahaemolyticus]|nr:DUF3265 domain-containing protein [Vibrio parahaemolyticus]